MGFLSITVRRIFYDALVSLDMFIIPQADTFVNISVTTVHRIDRRYISANSVPHETYVETVMFHVEHVSRLNPMFHGRAVYPQPSLGTAQLWLNHPLALLNHPSVYS